MIGTNLTGADLSHADLFHVIAEDAIFDDARLFKTNLFGALMNGVRAHNAEFTQASMKDIEFEEADLVVWSGPQLEPALRPMIARLANRSRVFEVLSADVIKVLPRRAAEGQPLPAWP